MKMLIYELVNIFIFNTTLYRSNGDRIHSNHLIKSSVLLHFMEVDEIINNKTWGFAM